MGDTGLALVGITSNPVGITSESYQDSERDDANPGRIRKKSVPDFCPFADFSGGASEASPQKNPQKDASEASQKFCASESSQNFWLASRAKFSKNVRILPQQNSHIFRKFAKMRVKFKK